MDTIRQKPRAIYSKAYQPFRASPSQEQQYQRSSGGGENNNSKFVYQRRRQQGSNQYKGQCEKTHSFSKQFGNTSLLVPLSDLKNVHPVIKQLFQGVVIPNIPLAGRLKYFQNSWKKLTKVQTILDIIEGYQIPFKTKPFQKGPVREI